MTFSWWAFSLYRKPTAMCVRSAIAFPKYESLHYEPTLLRFDCEKKERMHPRNKTYNTTLKTKIDKVLLKYLLSSNQFLYKLAETLLLGTIKNCLSNGINRG